MRYFLSIIFLFSSSTINAQLPSGSPAPDFTAMDTSGVEWNLYDLLADGKTVVLEMTATWSDGAFDYHQTGSLEAFYQAYGPDSMDEARVFLVETDDDTDGADLNGTGDDTTGDWTTDISYPIIDNAGFIADLYESYNYPDIIVICPNRVLFHAGRIGAFSLYAMSQACLHPDGVNNAGILSYNGFEGNFCEEVSFGPAITLQNLGTENLTNASIELFLNGQSTQTILWTGDLPLYGQSFVEFNTITVTEHTEIITVINSVNGTDDDDLSNDTSLNVASIAPMTDQNFLVVEITTDDFSEESYWEIRNASGALFHIGGNGGIFTGEEWAGTYPDDNTTYEHEISLPANGCYEFIMYDSYGDGICCGYGFGGFRLRNPDNTVIIQGGLFSFEDRQPFSLEGADELMNNASIFDYEGPQGVFCGALAFTPVVSMRNIGANKITTAEISIADGVNPPQTYQWDGNLPSGEMTSLNLPDLQVEQTTDLVFSISSINDEPDVYETGNTVEIGLARYLTTDDTLSLDIQTDNWGYEIYWQLNNSTGDVIASGGNETIGPDGGGLQVAEEGQPGAYDNDTTIIEEIILPADVNDCYELLIVDDYGDGLSGTGSFRMIDAQGNILFIAYPLGSYDSVLMDAQLMISTVNESALIDDFLISPNPVRETLNTQFSLAKNATVRISMVNALGEETPIKTNENLSAGQHLFSFDMPSQPSGAYHLKIGMGANVFTKKFVVLR